MPTPMAMDVVGAWQKVLGTNGLVPVDAASVIYAETGCKLFGLYVSGGMIGRLKSIKAARNMCHRLNHEDEEK